MASQDFNTSSGSKSRDTRGSEPSQDDVRDRLQGMKREKDSGLSGDSAGEESLDQGGAANVGSSGKRDS